MRTSPSGMVSTVEPIQTQSVACPSAGDTTENLCLFGLLLLGTAVGFVFILAASNLFPWAPQCLVGFLLGGAITFALQLLLVMKQLLSLTNSWMLGAWLLFFLVALVATDGCAWSFGQRTQLTDAGMYTGIGIGMAIACLSLTILRRRGVL